MKIVRLEPWFHSSWTLPFRETPIPAISRGLAAREKMVEQSPNSDARPLAVAPTSDLCNSRARQAPSGKTWENWEGEEFKATHLSLKHVDLPVLDVHVILELGELGVHAVPLLLRLHRGLRLLLGHPVLLLQPLPHFVHLHARNHAHRVIVRSCAEVGTTSNRTDSIRIARPAFRTRRENATNSPAERLERERQEGSFARPSFLQPGLPFPYNHHPSSRFSPASTPCINGPLPILSPTPPLRSSMRLTLPDAASIRFTS